MGGKEKEGRVGGRGKGKGGEGKGERMWRGPESGLPRDPCWLSAGLLTPLNRHAVTKYCTRDYVHHICPHATFGQDRTRGHSP